MLNELLQDLSWIVTIRVDGSGFLLQGYHVNYTSADTVGVYITPTRTIFTLDAGPVRVNLTYLSPIEVIHFLFHLETYTYCEISQLNDWTLHSLPFVYLAVDIWSTDGNPHAVQLYSDVTGRKFAGHSHSHLTDL